MSLTGKAATDNLLRGSIHRLDTLVVNAYEIAVKNGFVGTEKEWLDAISAKSGEAKLGEVTLLASAWEGGNSLYSQIVSIDDVTENSQVDLTPSVEQLAIFHEKDLTFVTENDGGVVSARIAAESTCAPSSRTP